MASKSQTEDPITQAFNGPGNPFAQLQDAGLGNMMGMGAAWVEAIGELSAEVTGFVAERIKEDVKTQQEILNCRSVKQLQNVQTEFIKRAMDQYQAETGKLVEMNARAFAPKNEET